MLKKISIITAALLAAVILYVDLSEDKFREKVQRDTRQVTETASQDTVVQYSRAQLQGLPEPVRRYFSYVLKEGQELIHTVALKQAGDFRVKESDRWVQLEAEQHTATRQPSFVWHGRLKPVPYAWIEARDIYYNGSGLTENKLLSAFPLMFDSGKEADLSSLSRFLTEAPWYPTALLPGKNLQWKALNANSARAVINNAGYSVSADFTFAENGAITEITTENRYRNIKGKKENLRWTGRYANYRDFQGIKIPVQLDASWTLPEGNYTYARLRLDDVRYNER